MSEDQHTVASGGMGTGSDTGESAARSVHIELIDAYRFSVAFSGHEDAPLLMDEPEPLGEGSGPNASSVLAAAVGNCLSASLLYCLRRARVDVENLETEVKVRQGRNDHGRLRIVGLDVSLNPQIEGSSGRIDRCLGLFEDFCVVTESVRNGIEVNVDVRIEAPKDRHAEP